MNDGFAITVGLTVVARPGVCQREAEKVTGQKAVRVSDSVPAPKKIRDVQPAYPELPPGSQGSGIWLGEALIDSSGKVVRVWLLREIGFVPPSPAYNVAIEDAIKRWEFEPVRVNGKAVPTCITITSRIHWQ